MSDSLLDSTRTPRAYFVELNRTYRFVHDLFAAPDNALCEAFFSKSESAFEGPWPLSGWSFGNPPYSRGTLPRAVAKAVAEAKRGARSVLLIPATPGTEWFQKGLLSGRDVVGANSVRTAAFEGYELMMVGGGFRQKLTFLAGRTPFDPPIGWPAGEKWNPPSTDSVLVELRPPFR